MAWGHNPTDSNIINVNQMAILIKTKLVTQEFSHKKGVQTTRPCFHFPSQ